MLRLMALVLAMLAAAPAFAQPSSGSLADQACAFYAPTGSDPRVLIASPPPPCRKAIEHADGRVSYARFSGLDARAERGDPLEFSFRLGRAEFQQVYFRFADGAIRRASTPLEDALRPLADNSLYFTVPWRPVALTDIMVESRGYENSHGVAARPRLQSRSANLARLADLRLLYGLFGGAILAMLAYNLMLWWSLRYRFIAAYCAVGATMLAFGLCWSGLLPALVPAVTINLQVGFNFLNYMAVVVSLAVFLLLLIESSLLPRWLWRATLAVGAVGIASCLLRLIGSYALWRALDLVTYAALFGMFALILTTIGYALARNSVAIRYFLIAWTLPIAFGVWRTAWGAGLVANDSAMLDVSPFGVMALEMVLSGLGLAARVRVLRTERDDAQAMRAMLQHMADTDSLSGLYNRRAFLERAQRRDGDQRLIMLDIDSFKAVNDRFGHEAGDWVIVEIARLLRAGCPPDALIGRIGGEEFAIVVPAGPAHDQLAATLLLQIAYAPMPVRVKVTASAGEATGPARSDALWSALYTAADGALYLAKADGRNCVRHAQVPAPD